MNNYIYIYIYVYTCVAKESRQSLVAKAEMLEFYLRH